MSTTTVATADLYAVGAFVRIKCWDTPAQANATRNGDDYFARRTARAWIGPNQTLHVH